LCASASGSACGAAGGSELGSSTYISSSGGSGGGGSGGRGRGGGRGPRAPGGPAPAPRGGRGPPRGPPANVISPPRVAAAQRSGSPVAGTAGAPGGAGGGDWALVALVAVFGAGLILLFPWLAYVEERVFRTGLEDAGLGGQAWTALKFGLLHMIMFIPLAAALAVGVAGFVYGWIYRHAYRRSAGRRRSARAGPFGVPLLVVDAADRHAARADALFASTVWHVTFNSLIVLLVVAAFIADAL
jgi:hypothetical protein